MGTLKYREELRTTISRSAGKSRGGGAFTGSTESQTRGGRIIDNNEEDPEAWSNSVAASSGDSQTWTQSESEGESLGSVLIPILGKELSHVQFRSLEEQLFRAMAVLFDQQQRQGVARIVGMNAPVSIMTPDVKKVPPSPQIVTRYLNRIYENLPFALSRGQALKQITDRAEKIGGELIREAAQEPASFKRRLRR